jgi:hypothetical protein
VKILGLLTVLLATAVAAPSASAAVTCGGAVEHPFAPWLDVTPYSLAEGGSLESTSGWTLSGGARLVAGNEPFFAHSPTDSHSLYLPAGSSATSPWTCVALDSLTARFFAVSSGSALGKLNVDLVYRTRTGQIRTLGGISLVLAGLHRSWSPTLPVVLELDTALRDVLVLDVNATEIAFRFTPTTGLLTSSSWKIDDLYVDPWADRLWGS